MTAKGETKSAGGGVVFRVEFNWGEKKWNGELNGINSIWNVKFIYLNSMIRSKGERKAKKKKKRSSGGINSGENRW